MAKKTVKPTPITAKLAQQIADGEVQLIPSEVANQLTPAVMAKVDAEVSKTSPRRRIVKPAAITAPAAYDPKSAKAEKKGKRKVTGNLIDALGLPRLEKRTKPAMLKRAEEIERMIKKGDVPKDLLDRALERAAFYRQQGE